MIILINISTIYFTAALLVSIVTSAEVQHTNTSTKNSSIKFVNNLTTSPSQSYIGLIILGANAVSVPCKVSYILNCLVEYDTIYFSTTFAQNYAANN